MSPCSPEARVITVSLTHFCHTCHTVVGVKRDWKHKTIIVLFFFYFVELSV